MAIIAINLYVILLPLLPAVNFWVKNRSPHARITLQNLVNRPSKPDQNSNANRLVIPAMLLDEPFYQGQDAKALNQGPWLRPQGSTPEQNSNTVIAGHRFTYTNPRANFYYLDKLKMGDDIALFWQGKKYIYSVSKTEIVHASATEIEKPTSDARLTLYTCTPLWNPKDRLVVTAALEPIL